MSKTRDTGFLGNVVKVDASGNVSFVSGSTTLATINTSGQLSGSSPVLSASYASNAELLDGLDSTVFTLTSSFNAQTASFTAFSSSINSFSASILSYTASQNITNGTFTTTASFNAQTASFTAFTASILAQTASINSFSASILTQTASLNSFSSSVLTFTGSAATRLGALEAATASLYTTTSSLNSFSASVLTFTGSASTRLGALESYTSSLNNKTSSFATTGSNNFIGTQTISGSVLQSGSFTSTGTLTAQTLVVQTITSSVVYSSGSNIFGNAIGNTQTFTGSVLVTGSLTIAGGSSATSYSGVTIYGSTAVCSPVGKFTSCIDAGSGTFSGNVGINCISPNYRLHVNGCTAVDGNIRMGSGFTSGNSTDPGITVQGYSNAGMYFKNCGVGFGAGSSTKMLFLSNSGSVGIGTEDPVYGNLSIYCVDNTPLSSSLWGTSATSGVTVAVYNGSQCANSVAGLRLITRDSGASIWNIYNVSTGASAGALAFGNGSGGAGCERLRITNDGITCFACQICAPVAIFSGCVSIGGADQGYQLDVKRTSTGDSTFDTVANFYKASTHNTGLLLRLKNTIVDLAANNITGGGGPTAEMSFSVSSGGVICTALTIASTGAATFSKSISANGGNSSDANNVFTGFTADLYAVAVRQKGASAGISGTQYMAQVISSLGADGLEIYTPNAKDLVLGTNATTRLTIASTGVACFSSTVCAPAAIFTGCVGIGIISPSSVLDVQSAASIIKLKSTTGTNSVYTNYENCSNFYVGTDSTAGGSFGKACAAVLWQVSCNSIVFATSNTEQMRITGGGNVGIGTAQTGGAITRQLEVYNTQGATTSNTYFRISGGAGGAYGGNQYIEFTQNDYGNTGVHIITGKIQVQSDPDGAGYAYGSMQFYTKGAAGNSSAVERMRITSGGYVGIGTCTPNNTLQVVNSQINGGIYNTNSSGDSIGMIPFQRNNANDFFGLCRNGQMSLFASPSCSNVFSIGTQNASDIVFGTNDVIRMRITSTGIACFACIPQFPGANLICSYTCTYSSYTAGCWLGLFAGDNGYNGAYAFTVVGQLSLNGTQLYSMNYSTVPYIHSSTSLGSTNGNDFYALPHTSAGHADNGILVCFRRARYSGNTPAGNRTEFCMNATYNSSFTATTYVLAWV